MSDWTDAVTELDAVMADFYGVTPASALKSITIQQLTRTRTTNGEMSDAWSTFADVSNVLVTEQDMEEREDSAQRIEGLQDVEFDMTYTAGVTSQMRILYNGCVYQISGVIVDETAGYRTIIETHQSTAPEKQQTVPGGFSSGFSDGFSK